MWLERISGGGVDLVDLAAAKAHLRLLEDDFDAEVQAAISAASIHLDVDADGLWLSRRQARTLLGTPDPAPEQRQAGALMGVHFRFLPTGDGLFTGKLAGRGLLAAPGPFYSTRRGHLEYAPAFSAASQGDALGGPTDGARAAAATTHDNQQRAPKSEDVPTFHCPLWPECGCPGGAMRPECPGLKSRKLKDRLWFCARMPVAAAKAFIWFLGLGRLL